MSQWLQVAAIVRIDDIRRNQVSVEEAKEMFEKSFGKECSWEHGDFEDAYNHPENYLPMGSEGSLTMSVWVNVEADSIIEWFKNKISSSSLGYGVRNAVIDVESELHVHKVWVYNPDNVAVQFSHDSKAKS